MNTIVKNDLETGIQTASYSKSSLWGQSFKKLQKNKIAIIGLCFLVIIFLFCFLGPLLSPYTLGKINAALINKPPSMSHWLGTDALGRDILTRLMQAGRISLTVGLASMVLSVFLGTLLGVLAGYFRGWIDTIIMRVSDILMTIPELPMLFILAAVLSEWKVPSNYRLYIVMIMLSIVGWAGLARLVRSQILSLREQEYIQAAKVLGLRNSRILFRHLLPNIFPLLIVVATLRVGGAILSESTLSYFGLGIVPPTATWGNMIDSANTLIDFQKRPWLWIPPGLAIFVTVISINLLGDGLRDALDPKMKK
ncbi:ABC transporter permease [Brevibacillus laterosporus]|uniref:oligopeptide ABC transporter permease n=1 Tax=Brevibacillus laterosporus TaxID=1465 RepID=UPI000363FD10|nr:oligopeptide ABC transporter permease [Brevibacillus laterosporus]ATO51606.1 peptide ABC transporter permease [Brevibacillus laterosporus DSM 25]MBG9802715.1 peptide ABC transporter permease [Brevibacillus laterosporus]MED2006313.1 ABC transporter permease [Brevibacillus laterosporus]MED4763040.1 ABC transporter permease [Brevibacillus laterosporus]TPH16381.1 ABC transporter permease [Brevibacillus laterosporus]